MMKAGNKEIEENYPEVMGKCFIVNAPWVFSGIWAVVKPWLPPRTLAKIEFYGKGPEFLAALKQFVDSDKIPSKYEGSAKLCYGIDAPWDWKVRDEPQPSPKPQILRTGRL